MPILIVLAFVLGIAIGFYCAGSEGRSYKLGFSALGLLVGIIIGLSSSPVVGACLAAGFSLAARLIAGRAKPHGESQAISLKVWLPPLCLFCIIGISAGIYARVNNTFSLERGNWRTQFMEEGFNSNQVDHIMDRLSGTVSAPAPLAEESTLLFSNEDKATWKRLTQIGLPPGELIEFCSTNATADITNEIYKLKAQGKTSQEIVDYLNGYFNQTSGGGDQP